MSCITTSNLAASCFGPRAKPCWSILDCPITANFPICCRKSFVSLTVPHPIWRPSACWGCATIRGAIYFHWACCCIFLRPLFGRSERPKLCAGCGGGCGAIRTRRENSRADYPPWLQEVVLRCLEIEPAWRYPTASQLGFELAHPDQVKLTVRAERESRDPITTVWRRRFNGNLN